ncbi:hypothetical protein Q8F55_003205 [Vanrija albida]|uniref:Zn(2)-C6 fungal-type domain-containing protein n=1 Tax=Vanrija albida TaxID=181172 RepID=A0ABR3QBV4_9TREE
MADPSAAAKRRAVNTCSRCQRLKLKCDHAHPCGACSRAHGAVCSYGEASADSSTPQPPRKRHRAVLVCTRCKRLRVKCDQARPCGACVSAKRGHACVFVPWPDEVEPPAAASAASASTATPHRGLEHDHTALHAHARAMGLEGDTPGDYHGMRGRIAELEARLDDMARGLSAGPTPAATPASLPTYSPFASGQLRELAARFPPAEEARRLLRDFLNFDTMFRVVHAASFTRRCEAALAQSSWEDADAPFLAMFAGALLVAAASTTFRTLGSSARTAAEERETRLRALMDALLDFCEDRAALGLDYVHARLIAVLTHTTGESSSPAKMWLALGKAGSAALLAGLHRDRAGEGMFDKEMRRRVWWQIVFLTNLTAERMNIGFRPTFPDVARPAVVADGVLDSLCAADASAADATPQWSGIPEWGYVDAKLLWVEFFDQRDALLADEAVPLLDRLAAAAALVDKLGTAMPGYLTIDNHPYHSPPWVHMQAVIMTIALDEAHVHLYRPHFGSADPEVARTALAHAVDAAHRLVEDIRMMTSYMLFSWIDAPTTALWTYGMKSFTGGMVMAYALLSGGEEDNTARHQADLDLVIGVLKSNLNMAGSSRSNAQALRTLEGLRATILARSGVDAGAESTADADPHDVTDPYTGRTVALPRAAPDVDLPGEWIEWDVLFRDLFGAGTLAT